MRKFLLPVFITAMTFFPAVAHALAFYLETAGGASQFYQGSGLFGEAAPTRGRVGLALNYGFFATFSDGNTPIELQVGLQHRFATSSNGSNSYFGLQVPYPIVRLQITKLYFGAGAIPFVWRRVRDGPGLDFFSPAKDATLSYVGEAGVLWSVTPRFTLGAGAAAQFVSSSAGISPSPAIEALMVMRFYFVPAKSGNTSSYTPNEFKGWRYPFGIEIRDHY